MVCALKIAIVPHLGCLRDNKVTRDLLYLLCCILGTGTLMALLLGSAGYNFM